jgi:hypothetical protein
MGGDGLEWLWEAFGRKGVLFKDRARSVITTVWVMTL